MAEDFYKVLGVSKTASQDEIQKAYLKLARKYHPDMNPDDPEGAKKKFQELQHAFDTLKDPEKRKQYDQFGEGYAQFGGAGGQGGFSGFNGFGNGGTFRASFNGSNINLDDILKGFAGMGGTGGANPFGGAGGPFGGARKTRRRPGPTKGANTTSALEIPFKTAILGGSLPLSLRDSATGNIKSVDVKIPAGIESGKKIKLRGLGEPGSDGGSSGDLLLTITVAPHPFYTRDGNDLRARVPITLKEAVLGGKVDVPTPYGVVGVKVPPCSSTGTKLRLKGFGVRQGNGVEDGNLYVVFDVALPKSWSNDDLKLLDKMKLDDANPRANLNF